MGMRGVPAYNSPENSRNPSQFSGSIHKHRTRQPSNAVSPQKSGKKHRKSNSKIPLSHKKSSDKQSDRQRKPSEERVDALNEPAVFVEQQELVIENPLVPPGLEEEIVGQKLSDLNFTSVPKEQKEDRFAAAETEQMDRYARAVGQDVDIQAPPVAPAIEIPARPVAPAIEIPARPVVQEMERPIRPVRKPTQEIPVRDESITPLENLPSPPLLKSPPPAVIQESTTQINFEYSSDDSGANSHDYHGHNDYEVDNELVDQI